MQRAVCTLCTSFGSWTFLAFFLLRELHTVYTAAYGSHWNQALALPPVGIEASSARQNDKCIRICIRIFADFGRKCPPTKLIRPCPSLIPLDAQAGFCPQKRFFDPSDGLSSFQAKFCCHQSHAVPQGVPGIRFSDNAGGWNKNGPET